MIGGAASKITVEIGGKLGASLSSSLKQAQTQVSSFSRNVSRTFNDAALAGKNAFQGVVRNPMWQAGAVAAAGIGAGLVSATRVAIDFEKQMSSVAAKMGDATEEQLTQLGSLAKELGRTTKFTAGETAAAMDFLAMAGFKTNDILSATPGVLNLAAVGNMELAAAADIASNILGGMGLEVSKTGRLIDVLAKTATSGNTSVEQLGNAFKSVGPVARTAGASIEDVGASLAILGDRGIQAEEAGTALRNVFVRLAAPPSEAAKALQRLGVSTKDTAGNMRPFQTILGDVDRRMKELNLGSAEQIELQSDIFGLRALAAGQILQEASATGELADRIKTVTDSQGAASEMAAKMQDNLGGALTRLGSAFEGFQLALAGPNSKVLQGFVDGLAGVIGKVTELMEAFPALSGAVMIAGAAFVGLIAIAPFLASFIAVVKSLSGAVAAAKLGAVIAGWAGAAGPALAAIKVGLVALTGPIGWTIAAIAGIGAAFVWAYQNVEWFRNGVNGVMARVAEIFAASWAGIRGMTEGFMTWLSGSWKMLTGILTLNPGRIQEGFGQAFEGIKQMASSWLSWMGAMLPSGLREAFGGAVAAATASFERLKGMVLGVAQFIWNNGLSQIANGIGQAFQGVVAVVQGVWNTIVGIFTGNSQQAVDGVRQAFAGIGGIFSGIANMAQGAWNLISSSASAMGSAIVGIVQSIPGQVASAWESLKQGAISAFQQMVAFIKTVPSMVQGVGQAIIDTIINGIKARAGALVDTVKETFANVRNLMPFSDAKEGPFKHLTASGKAIVTTLARGVREASPQLTRAMDKTAGDAMRPMVATKYPRLAAQAAPQLTAAGVPVRSTPVVPQHAPQPQRQGPGLLQGLMPMIGQMVDRFVPKARGLTTLGQTLIGSLQQGNILPSLEAGLGAAARSFMPGASQFVAPLMRTLGAMRPEPFSAGRTAPPTAPAAAPLQVPSPRLVNPAPVQVPAQQLVPPRPTQALGQQALPQQQPPTDSLAGIGRQVVTRLDAIVNSLAQAAFPAQPQPALAEVPVPTGSSARQSGPISFSNSFEINVSNSNASADDIADRVRLAFRDMLSDAEANVRAFLND
jgi:TP901 family phage tail tape measure protein